MGLFERIFGKAPAPAGKYDGRFKMLTGYDPHFSRFGGNIYEDAVVRSAIHARATQISKLVVELHGAAKPKLQTKLKTGPNEWQTWSQFLYKTSTILDIYNNCFIVPVFDEFGEISGIYSVLPDRCTFVDYGGKPYLRYEFSRGQHAAVELEYCGILTKFQSKDDFLGETNAALYPVMDVIKMQNDGIREGVKSGSIIRFIAKIGNFSKPDDLAKERKRFSRENLEQDGSPLLLFPNTYTDIKQVDSKPYQVDPKQMEFIKENVYSYFGVSDKLVKNEAYGDEWSAFYEGVVEPFAIQFSEVLTRMLFTFRERAQGSFVMATANRLQYLSNADKLSVSAQMLDRGIMSINDVREIWNLPPVDGGDVRIIRGEYYNADEKTQQGEGESNEAE